MTHLSRFSEELILWTSAQFGFVDLSDSFCTGSSIMPQKKNPDVPELVRGKSGRVIGHLMGLLTLMKAQPLAYNKDNQEDKEPLFDTVDTVQRSLKVFADMMPALTVNGSPMREAARRGFATATDLADYLVRKGIPFRDAHEIVGKAVRRGCGERARPRRHAARRAARLQRDDRGGRVRGADPGRLGGRPRPPRRHRAAPGRASGGRGAHAPRRAHRALRA